MNEVSRRSSHYTLQFSQIANLFVGFMQRVLYIYIFREREEEKEGERKKRRERGKGKLDRLTEAGG